MFTLQNQNQAIVTLSQVSAILTPRQNVYFNKKTFRKKNKVSTDIVCLESFIEAARNFDISSLKHLKTKEFFETKSFSNFRVSYVSNNSFYENKHGLADRKPTIPTLILNQHKQLYVPQNFYQKFVTGLKYGNHFTFDLQVRGFKTDRSVKAELLRNPGLGTRIKNTLGLSSPETIDPKVAKDMSLNNEKIKQILTQDGVTMTDAEKQRIKIAFAEGYLLANNPNAKTGKAARYFKVFQQVLTIVIFLAIVISLMVSTTGSVFR